MPVRMGLAELIILLGCFLAFIAIIVILAVLLVRSRPGASAARDRRDEDIPPVMTLDEVAALLRVDADTVEKLIQDGKLPAVKVGQEWRISSANAMAFINAGDETGVGDH